MVCKRRDDSQHEGHGDLLIVDYLSAFVVDDLSWDYTVALQFDPRREGCDSIL